MQPKRPAPAWIPYAQFLLSPLLIYFYTEYLATGKVFRAPRLMLLGYGLLLCGQLLFLFLFRRGRIAQCALQLICFVLALISHMKMDFRGTPLLPWDIFAAGTAIAVASHYSLQLSLQILVSLAMMLVTFYLAWRFPIEFSHSRKVALLRALGALLCCTLFFQFFQGRFILQDEDNQRASWSPARVYDKYGFGVGLWVNARLMIMRPPLYYNLMGLREEAMLPSLPQAQDTGIVPSEIIIVIMNETFSDMASVLPFTPSRDPMPFVRSLMEESVSGTLHVSVLGGGTSTSEFELLTGNTSRFLPVESTPYVQYLRADARNGYSIASHLKGQGFRTVAIHPGEPDAWSRDSAYPLMGIDAFYALPDMPDVAEDSAYLRGYYRDEGVYDRILEQYAQKKPGEKLFVLAVTIQNHGDYYAREPLSEDPVYILEAPEDARGSEYLTLVSLSDAAFADFLEEVKAWPEPTTVLFFGDHQPRLPEETYLAMCGENPMDWSEDRRCCLYQTPYLIWRNDGITPRNQGDLSINYLGGLLLEEAGIDQSNYMRMLSVLRQELPVITAHTIRNAQGQKLGLRQARSQVPLLNMYQSAQYNLLFDTLLKQRWLFR